MRYMKYMRYMRYKWKFLEYLVEREENFLNIWFIFINRWNIRFKTEIKFIQTSNKNNLFLYLLSQLSQLSKLSQLSNFNFLQPNESF
jgi:hypothetical protein